VAADARPSVAMVRRALPSVESLRTRRLRELLAAGVGHRRAVEVIEAETLTFTEWSENGRDRS
jgi:hypothetical protein